jgi:hypothetical protein
LYPKSDGEKSLPLTTAVEQFGRFDDDEMNKIEFKSVLITGRCCWEAFSRYKFLFTKFKISKMHF